MNNELEFNYLNELLLFSSMKNIIRFYVAKIFLEMNNIQYYLRYQLFNKKICPETFKKILFEYIKEKNDRNTNY